MADSLRRSSLLTALIDPIQPTTDQAERAYRPSISKMTWMVPTLMGIALLVVSAALGFTENFREQFYFSYLVGWTFCLSLALGALFVILIKHLTKAHWIVSVRRIPEALLASFPMLLVLAIPIIFGLLDHDHGLYHHWTAEGIADPNSSYYDEIIAGKVAYLNIPFFLIRVALYFAVWIYLSHRLYRLSLQQDVDPDPSIPAKQRRVSAWGLPLCAVATAFASYDFLMSLDPHWFSTIFGVYFFGGAFLSAFSLTALVAILLQRSGLLRNVVSAEHYQDLG